MFNLGVPPSESNTWNPVVESVEVCIVKLVPVARISLSMTRLSMDNIPNIHKAEVIPSAAESERRILSSAFPCIRM